jgi:AcrR family transcriptional regulator
MSEHSDGVSPNIVRQPTGHHLVTRERILEAAWELARERGVAGFSLRDLAARVGMKAPSLFVYFDGKNALFDAMFAQGWAVWFTRRARRRWPPRTRPRARVAAFARAFVEFALEDPVRYQLLAMQVVPGFVPSEESMAANIADQRLLMDEFAALGVDDVDAAWDLYTAVVAGLLSQQFANDPGGRRWVRRLPELMHLLCDHWGLPAGPYDAGARRRPETGG